MGEAADEVSITRWRLIDALDQAPPGALVLIVAAAGYGKSTLLRQWSSRASRATVVVQAEPGHDGDLLARSITEGIARVTPDASSLLERARRSEVDWACDLLPHLLGFAAERPVALVIDDTHLLSTSSSQELVHELARSWPAPSVLVLSGRVRPDVPLVRDRLDAPVVTIGHTDLDFDDRELATILEIQPVDIDQTDLLELTGGWPAGIRLAAIVEGGDLAAHLDHGPGDPALSVERYLSAHVLSSFTPHELDYLGHLAVLAPAPARIVDSVLHRNDTAEVLSRLSRRGLPLVTVPRGPDDPVVVHTLLADVLTGRLDRRRVGAVDELVELAAHQLERSGEVSFAVDLLERKGRHDDVRAIIYRNMFPLVATGRTGELRRWLERYDQAEKENDPVLVLAYANVLRPREERVVRALFARHADDTTTELPDGTTPAVACKRMLVAFGLDPADREDTALLGGWRQTGRGRLAWDLYSDDRLDEAEEVLLSLAETGAKYPLTNAVSLAKRAIIALETGRPDETERLGAEAAAIVTEERMEETALGFIVDTVALKLARRAGELEHAEEIATGVRRKMAIVGDGTMLERVTTLIELGNLYVDLAYPARLAASMHGEAVAITDRWPSTVRLDRQLAQLERRMDEGVEATRAPPGSELISAAELRVLRYLPSHLTLARIAQELFVSHSTVKTQCQSIYRKLGVTTRAEAVTAATQLALLS